MWIERIEGLICDIKVVCMLVYVAMLVLSVAVLGYHLGNLMTIIILIAYIVLGFDLVRGYRATTDGCKKSLYGWTVFNGLLITNVLLWIILNILHRYGIINAIGCELLLK